MTRAVRSRILKDVNGDINDHLRNHIHLTNCIHLKNHMHKQSPILADRSLMRDLIVLQRSRSLRDPSASPPSWHSPSVADLLSRQGEKDVNRIQEGRRSLGADRPPRQGKRLSGTGSSPPFNLLGSSRVAPGELLVGGVNEVSEHHRDSRRLFREEQGREEYSRDSNEYLHDIISRKSNSRETKKKGKGKHVEDSEFKTLSERLNDVRMDSDDVGMDSDDVVSSNMRPKDRGAREGKSLREPGGGALNRGKRRKFRAARRNRAPVVASRDARIQSELSVASNSLGQGYSHRPNPMDEGEEEEEGVYREQNVTRAPRNGCGIPFNWSRIHHRGRTFLDKAGRSLSCGLTERRGDAADDMQPVQSNPSMSSSKSDAEALPLLVGSQESSENAAGLHHDYSGELGLYADDLLLKHGRLYSDLASEGRSGGQGRVHHKHRHQNLTQTYMPRTFKDLVGQNLVVQALSNAVMRRKIGILYVFYGPHGTGKTSCARIFARALNCQSSDSQKPCGYCKSCVAQDTGKSRHVREVGPISNFENIMDLLDSAIVSQLPSQQHRVFILDDCDNLSSDCWSAISKVIDRAPRRVVFLLVCSSLDVLPHIIISRCHKFFFPKLKDADIIGTLQWISTKEHLEVDKDALKLIASRSDGSLRDALMTLDQLSLLGQRICITLVQELVGLISDEKLVDLLDLALSADTVNTVKSLRVIMETGVEPLALMSQLATVVTDILAGSYDFTKERNRRKFFRRQPLSKEEMERLRQALKTLSEAEKQLRMSNDKTTWLTAALLQLAPDQQYLAPNSSANNSSNQSPSNVNNGRGREANGGIIEHSELRPNNGRGWPLNDRMESVHLGGGSFNNPKGHARAARPVPGITYKRIDDIWLDVLEQIQVNSIKEFLFHEGKLISISFGAAPTVQLTFSSPLIKAKAEKVRGHILQAFESVVGSTVTIEIRCEPGGGTVDEAPLLPLPDPKDGVEVGRKSEIVEVGSPGSRVSSKVDRDGERRKALEANARMKLSPPSSSNLQRRMKFGEKTPSQSIVRGKVSLAHVIQQVEGCSQRSGWSRKAVSIAEKLEQENLRLEPRSRSLLCWKACGTTRRKLSRLRLKMKTRRSRSLLRLVSCGKCLSGKSPSKVSG